MFSMQECYMQFQSIRSLKVKKSIILVLLITSLTIMIYFSPAGSVAPWLSREQTLYERRGRRADYGRWYSQTTPFPLHIYSAFYDNRTSLQSTSPQIAVIAQFHDRRVDRCLIWFKNSQNYSSVPAKTQSLNLADKLVVCRLADRFSVSRIPEEVALAWTNKTTKSGISHTPFRVPVEIPRQRPTRGRLALCLAAAFHGDWNSRQIVEWLEMQRLLGFELVVVYNRSMSAEAGKVFSEYNKQGQLDNGDRFVELRQSRGWLDGVDSKFGHQTSTINDCMYRYMGSFRYLAVIDFDEVIVPRKNFTTIPQLIDNLTLNRTVGSFLFRNAQYFVGPLKDDNYDDVYRLIPASQRNSSLSIYLTRRRRAAVSPPHFVVKSVLDADACIGMWVHYCMAYTSQFQEKRGADVVSRLDVDVELAQKHHYRTQCNFDLVPSIYAPGSCTRAMQTAFVDNVLEKYSSRLVTRLLEQYEKLKLF